MWVLWAHYNTRDTLVRTRETTANRILILVENLPVPFDRRVWMEATTLAEAGYRVTVICPRGDYSRLHEVLSGISIYRYPLPSFAGIAGHLAEYALAVSVTFFVTWFVLLREGFDVIQSANPPDLFFLIGGFFKLFGKKFIFDHHDLTPEACETRWSGWKLKLMHNLCLCAERATFRTADRVIATNESYREVALTRGGVAPDKVFVVRSGPSLDKFRPVLACPELKNGRRFLVCYLGVMGPNDGLEYLLRAISYLVCEQNRKDVYFVLIGGGDMHSGLVEMSETLGLGDCVRFAGRIPDEEVIALISSADVCVAPDPKDPLNDVSTMNKIVEYMALGKPVVAFDLHEARVSAGDAAVYATANDPVSFGQRIAELLSSPQQREQMGLIARKRFESSLAWETQRGRLLSLYAELLNGQCVSHSETASRS
jgi:glycosyltransferase involved in cell wall biosynthesis